MHAMLYNKKYLNNNENKYLTKKIVICFLLQKINNNKYLLFYIRVCIIRYIQFSIGYEKSTYKYLYIINKQSILLLKFNEHVNAHI